MSDDHTEVAKELAIESGLDKRLETLVTTKGRPEGTSLNERLKKIIGEDVPDLPEKPMNEVDVRRHQTRILEYMIAIWEASPPASKRSVGKILFDMLWKYSRENPEIQKLAKEVKKVKTDVKRINRLKGAIGGITTGISGDSRTDNEERWED